MQHLPKELMWARSYGANGAKIIYALCAKQVACPRYGWYGRLKE